MRSSKIDRALYGPSVFEVTFGAILSALLGAVLAIGFMILKPVEVAKDQPKEEERVQGAVYFLEGNVDPGRSRQWIRKRQMLMEGTPGEIAFSEEELNAWFSSGIPPKAKKPAPRPAAKAAASGKAAPAQPPSEELNLLVLETPNVRIRDSVFQVGVPGSLNLLTFSLPVVLQSQGTFEKVDEMWMFKPSAIHLGSMPLHRIPGFTDQLVKRLMTSSLIPEDALASWKRVEQVVVDGKALKITFPAVEAPAASEVEPPAPGA